MLLGSLVLSLAFGELGQPFVAETLVERQPLLLAEPQPLAEVALGLLRHPEAEGEGAAEPVK